MLLSVTIWIIGIRNHAAVDKVQAMNKSNLKIGARAKAASLAQLLIEQLDAIDTATAQFPVAISVAAADLEDWGWLTANEGLGRFVWSDRDSAEVWAGLGVAAEVNVTEQQDVNKCVSHCRDLLRGNNELIFFGGLSFDGQGDWEAFGRGKFVVPRLQLRKQYLTLAVMDAEDIRNARYDLQQVRFDAELPTPLPKPLSKSYIPNADGWQTRIDEALALIRSEAVEKIVLSRKTIFEFSESIDPIQLTSRLNATTNHCFVFCLDVGAGNAFVGATPERLFLRKLDELKSEVVAGTRMRGHYAEEDERLGIELLNSDKDQREHDIVRKSIRQKLHKYVDHLIVDSQASLLRLARKQHLLSNVEGKLKPGVDDGTLLNRLHPTPAVGGYPTDNALPEIARIEPFNRGWYAAPIGWISSESAHFAVAIRSGLIENNTLTLFSGAGIVHGSDPAEEWQEVESKIQDFISVIGRSYS